LRDILGGTVKVCRRKGFTVSGKNPLGKLTKAALGSLKDPIGTAGKVAEQAKGTATLGRFLVEQVGKTAYSVATDTAGSVLGRQGRDPASTGEAGAPLRPVPDVNEPAAPQPPAPARTAKKVTPKTPAKKTAAARKATQSGDTRKQGDPMPEVITGAAEPAAKPPVKKATAKKAPAQGATAKNPLAKGTAAKKTAGGSHPPSPADVAEIVEAKVAEDPSSTAAVPAKKTPAKKAPAKRSAPGAKLPRKTSQPSAASAAEVLRGGPDTTTSAGTVGSPAPVNPDTGLPNEAQREEPGLNESVANAVASKSEFLRRAAEKNPGEDPEKDSGEDTTS
jgi:hypothetical protein